MPEIVVPYDRAWASAYAIEAEALSRALDDPASSFHHVGSTAIPGLLSKPIIDILCVAESLDTIDSRHDAFASLGYEAKGAYGIEGRRYFRKFDIRGRRTHHLHVFAAGSPHVVRHLAFRDYLRAHPSAARDYSDLKSALSITASANRASYQDGKAPFIAETEARALKWYQRTVRRS